MTVAALVHEFSRELTGGRIGKIAQTESDELMLTLKRLAECGGGQRRLYLSADATLPLAYLSDESKTSPMTAPGFCMLLRKHIQNGRILSIEQPSLERIIRIRLEHMDELGDLRRKTLLIELMGKYSNIIFVDEEDTIIDSIKHIPASVSSVREVLPGKPYFIPDTQNKANPLTASTEEVCAQLGSKAQPLFKAILSCYTGLSTVMAQEICSRAGVDSDIPASACPAPELARVSDEFVNIMQHIRDGSFAPTLVLHGGEPAEYAAFPLTMYEHSEGYELRSFDSMSALIEYYYAEKNKVTRIRQKSTDLRRIVTNAIERCSRKYDLQTAQMKDTQKKDKARLYGELLTAYAYSIEEGASSVVLNDYNTGEDVKITLDPTLTANQNASKFYAKYDRLKRTAEALTVQLAESSAELEHLQSISTSLDIAREEADLTEIREELIASGYLKRKGGKKGPASKVKGKPFHYISSDGFDIFVGKNNFQNDELTFKVADGGDWWFHAKKIPGSHVVLKTGGREVPDRAFEEAAALAAYYSKGAAQEKVEIDYLQRKNVKKPGGAKPGFVVYYTNYSMAISPDISQLKQI